MSKTTLPMFSCRSFIVSGHIVKYLIHFCVPFSIWCIKVTPTSVSLLIFCLENLSVDISMVLKFPIIIALLRISLFMFVNVCFMLHALG